MDLPQEPREWSESDLKLFGLGERKAVVLRRLDSDEETSREELSTKEDWDNWFSRAPGVSPSWDKFLPGIYVMFHSTDGYDFTRRFGAVVYLHPEHRLNICSRIFVELERKRLLDAVDQLVDEFTLNSDQLESKPWNIDPKADEDGQKTQKAYLNVCLRSRNLVDHIQASKRQLSKFLDEMDEVADELRSLGPEDGWTESPAMKTKLGKIGRDMRKRVQDIIREYDDKIDECNKVVCNTSLAMQTVWNHMMRKDSFTTTEISKANRAMAFDTRHESAQMRTIAILTMIYLPLSSVAAIFSMDMFNWEAGAGESIVSKHIWLFAVLTVGLTFLTLVAWRVGTQRSKDVTKKADKYFAELQRQGTFV
ncbi:hypothetical protein CGCSCA4_v012596 [Colletotrichum siamense]|uniref:CorA-like Mg2+ transporter n=2 Tax=Colletotrichum siamense TaxID=690259 RepID=A0A9P5EJY2_COLSI|nr:hypothetical protein CGCTS75_v011864 [Colletotrichum tropicale]KAF4835464.1 hypothetical protein CGCSCA4_v012596 [Colletotrichum siamense]KAF4848345.1 hypothetical protein CGCSCA2_v012300 [Colletotrichum siamense]